MQIFENTKSRLQNNYFSIIFLRANILRAIPALASNTDAGEPYNAELTSGKCLPSPFEHTTTRLVMDDIVPNAIAARAKCKTILHQGVGG